MNAITAFLFGTIFASGCGYSHISGDWMGALLGCLILACFVYLVFGEKGETGGIAIEQK